MFEFVTNAFNSIKTLQNKIVKLEDKLQQNHEKIANLKKEIDKNVMKKIMINVINLQHSQKIEQNDWALRKKQCSNTKRDNKKSRDEIITISKITTT